MVLKWITNLSSYEYPLFTAKTTFKTIKGDPKGTDAYSVERLKKMQMVGVYAKIEEGENDEREVK